MTSSFSYNIMYICGGLGYLPNNLMRIRRVSTNVFCARTSQSGMHTRRIMLTVNSLQRSDWIFYKRIGAAKSFGFVMKGEYGIMKTFMASPSTIDRKWYVVDATGYTLGRLASEIAKVLRGKNKPIYTPHLDMGDYVIVVNADKVKVTGKKLDQKIYYHHSGFVGGLKETTLREKLAKKPEEVIELAVKGMLPKGPLGRDMYKKLFVYAGPEHKHAAQKPEELKF